MPHGMGQREPQSVVRHSSKIEGTPVLEPATATKQDKWDIGKGMRIPLTQFIDPDNLGVIQQTTSCSTWFGDLRKLICQVSQFASEPLVDP